MTIRSSQEKFAQVEATDPNLYDRYLDNPVDSKPVGTLENRGMSANNSPSPIPNTPLPPQRRWRRWVIGLVAAGALLGATAVYLTNSRTQPQADAMEALTVPVEAKNLTVRITASGEVQPIQRVNLSPKSQGRIAQLFVEQGDRVQQGQVVARMESRDLEAQLLQAKARLASAQARLDKQRAGSRVEEIAATRAQLNQRKARLELLQAGSRDEEIAGAQAKLEQAQAQLADAKSGSLSDEIDQAEQRIQATKAELELAAQRVIRYRGLEGEGAISQDRLEEYIRDERRLEANVRETQQRLQQLKESRRSEIARREAAVAQEQQSLKQLQNGSRPEEIAQAQAEVAEAQSKLDELVNGTRSEDIAQAEADVAEAIAQVRYQEVLLEESYVRAPFAGIITQRYATQGAFVTPATSASEASSATSTSIVALARDLEVLAKVPEADISQIKPGQTVEIVADAYPDQVFQGRVHLIAPEAVKEKDVTLFQVRVYIVTGKNQLQSGMNVDVQFLGDQLKNALVVPTVAIITNKGETGVLIPDAKQQPKFHPVTVGSTIGNQMQILEGLKAGDRIFLELPAGKKLEDFINKK